MAIGFLGEACIKDDSGARASKNCLGLGVHSVSARKEKTDSVAAIDTGNQCPPDELVILSNFD